MCCAEQSMLTTSFATHAFANLPLQTPNAPMPWQ
jgi:hypothetical protein